MITNLIFFNSEGVEVPVTLGKDSFSNLNDKTVNKYFSGAKKGLRWTYMGSEISITDMKSSVIGYPFNDLKHMIVIYQGVDGKFKPPYNAAIYNANGTLKKILEPPMFSSKLLLKRLHADGVSNPPLDLTYEGALFFNGVFWRTYSESVVTCLSIIYDREWFETRILINPDGDFGECLFSGKV